MNVADLRTCRQTVFWEPMTGRDDYGKPTYGAPQSFRGRRSLKTIRIATKSGGGRGLRGEGVDTISDSQIWILASITVGYEDRVYVSGDDPEKAPPIVSVALIPDATGEPKFVKVMLGSALG